MQNLYKKFKPDKQKVMVYNNENFNYTFSDQESYDDLYSKNVIIYRCINLIAKNIANIPCNLKNEDGIILHNHDLHKLIKKPNKHNNWFSLIDSVITDLLLYGNIYLFKSYDEVIKLNSNELKVISDSAGNPYKYKYGNKEHGANDEQLLHIKLTNPYSPWEGMSPIETIKKSASLYDTITKYNKSILDNGGRISGALIFDEQLTEAQRQILKDQLNSNYTGSDKAGKVILLEGNAKWKEMSISPKDIDFHQGKLNSAKEIALAFGVPPVMLGIQDSSFNHYKEARLHFWEDTILPLANMILNQLQSWLVQEDNLKLEYDFSNIPALFAKTEDYKKHIDSLSFLSEHEKRQLCGYKK
ncbi:phage portal protein [Candidatus Cytomitobacter primus]|nr:phage portal protein [Candidatus Cytomitobacter primus]